MSRVVRATGRLPELEGGSHANGSHHLAMYRNLVGIRGRVRQGVPIGAQNHDCDVSRAFGMFKAVTSESWLLFEDKDGTLRAVDYGCHRQWVINRR
jgi:hypothetical protein